MGIALEVFRLVRFDGAAGCRHHLLARAGRPSYPNFDQSAEDAAESLLESTLATLTAWCARSLLPRLCRAGDHRVAVVGETDYEGVLYPDTSQDIDLLHDIGMRTVDIWVAGGPHNQLALALADDARTFWSAVAADPPAFVDDLVRPGEALRVLFITDRSGAGDLRNL